MPMIHSLRGHAVLISRHLFNNTSGERNVEVRDVYFISILRAFRKRSRLLL